MVQLNPNVQPVGEPNFLAWSKPVQQPHGYSPLGVAAAGVGTLFHDVVKTADLIDERTMDNQLHQAIDEERNKYKGDLEEAETVVRTAAASGTATGASSTGGGAGPGTGDKEPGYQGSSLDVFSNKQSAPELQGLEGKVAALDNMRNNRKISETDYFGRLDSVASDFRARYPGRRDQIDKIIHNVIGGDPANMKIRSMIGDINSFLTTKNDQRNKMEARAWQLQTEGAITPQNYKDWRDGKISDDQLIDYGSSYWKMQADHKRAEYAYQEHQQDTTLGKESAESYVTDYAHRETVMALKKLQLSTGMKLEDWMAKVEQGYQPPPEEIAQVKQALTYMRAGLVSKLNSAFNQNPAAADDIDPKHKNPAQTLGQAGLNNAIEASLKGTLDQWSDFIGQGKFDLAGAVQQLNEQKIDYTVQTLLKSPNGDTFALFSALNKLAKGNNNIPVEMFKTYLGSKDYKPADQSQLTILKGQIRTGLNIDKPGQVKTYRDAIKDLDHIGQKNPKVYKNVIDDIDALAKPEVSLDEKLNIARSAYDRRNVGLTNEFSKDDQKFTVYNKYTSSAMASEVKKLSKADSSLPDKMRDWAGGEFGELFGPLVLNLGTYNHIAAQEHGQVRYDTDTHSFVYESVDHKSAFDYPGKHAADQGRSYTPSPSILSAIKKINMGLAGQANVASILGGPDVNVQLVNHMLNIGLDPTTPGLPGDLVRAFIAAHKPKEGE